MKIKKVAIVHEWLTIIGGSENVFKAISSLYPDADIFTLVADPKTIQKLGLQRHKVSTSFIQRMPFAVTKYRTYLPLFPLAIEQFDLSKYDLIISSSHAAAKGVLTNSAQMHICYCHSPIRYAWDLYHQYLKESKLDRGLKGILAKYFLHRIRTWDIINTNRVDHFISNSNYIGKRIKKIYNRESTTVYPNVAVEEFKAAAVREEFYFTCSRLVPYKKIDLIVNAFAAMPDKVLYVMGDGPDMNKIKKIARSNVKLLGYQPFEILKEYLGKAKAFVFAAEEDFGIIPVEAQACGTPVIAFGKGGSLETVIDNVTGILFYEQTESALADAIHRFENRADPFDTATIIAHAKTFSEDRFKKQLKSFIDSALNARGMD